MKRVVGRVAPALLAVVACGSLAACGSSSDEASGSATVKPATSPEIDKYTESTVDDVQKLAKKVAAAHDKDGSFPKSGKGLVDLASGNEIGVYKVQDVPAAKGLKVVKLCVQHVEKQPNPNNTKEVIDLPLAAANIDVREDQDRNAQIGGTGTSKGDGCTGA